MTRSVQQPQVCPEALCCHKGLQRKNPRNQQSAMVTIKGAWVSAQHKNDRLLVGAHTQRSVRLSPSPRPCLAWLETGCQSADLGAIIDIQLLGSTVPEWEQVCKSLGSKLGPELLKARTLQPLRLTQAWGRQAASKNLLG